MQQAQLKVRTPVDIRVWLDMKKTEEKTTHTAIVIAALRAAMSDDPLVIVIHECNAPDGAFFTASIGKHGDDFYDGPDRAAAFAAARAKAKELGLPRSAIRLEVEDFTDL